jgi:hypothetical protein
LKVWNLPKEEEPIIAEIIGYGFSSNGGHISTPNVDGPALAMDRALKQSGLKLQISIISMLTQLLHQLVMPMKQKPFMKFSEVKFR